MWGKLLKMLLPLLEYLLQSIQLFILLIWAIWLFLEVWSFWLHYSAGAQLVPYFWPFLELFHVDQGEKYSNITSVPQKMTPSAVVIHYCTWYHFFTERTLNLNHCWNKLTPQPIMSNDFYLTTSNVRSHFGPLYLP